MPTNMQKAQPDERERQRAALELRLEGKTYDAIAEALGYRERGAAYRAVEAVLSRVESESVAEYREVVGLRLEALHATHWPAARAGDLKAGEFCAKIGAQLAKLYGMNAPEKLQVQPVGLDHEAFTTTVDEDMRALGLHPQMDLPLTEADPDGEPWANTGDIPGQTAAGRRYVPSTRADNQTGESNTGDQARPVSGEGDLTPPPDPAVSTLPGHTLGTVGRNGWDATVGGKRSTWADVLR